ncbi:hypothetical protein [Bacillus albus]|uniref:hypothetical protein n=1 Tax=Bacillus albus TaxID=2026189 RepID=UPI003D1916FF
MSHPRVISIDKKLDYPVTIEELKNEKKQIRQMNKGLTLLFIARTLFLFHHHQAKIFIYTLNKNFIFLPLVICKNGTHVAGQIAANGNLKGITPRIGIKHVGSPYIAIKLKKCIRNKTHPESIDSG